VELEETRNNLIVDKEKEFKSNKLNKNE